ncbi:hypothetical protein C0Q70_05614 [Pomacea canaliculata]|uniref:Phosphoribosylformylglycinamidine synthase n=1 Tax=Pomacea canaliculata TaxID=400727 RepID=A0A2T7PLN7_POMCA|nr:hypothetical protein C0Q70_05614 [Pomacea canaliculata]
MPHIFRLYQNPALTEGSQEAVVTKINCQLVNRKCVELQTEICFYINVDGHELTEDELECLMWVLSTPFQEDHLTTASIFKPEQTGLLVEIGPRLNFCTPFSTNCVSICQSVGLHRVTRVECSTRFLLNFEGEGSLLAEEEEKLVLALHDRMTQCRYMEPLTTFEQSVHADNIFEVDVIEKGREALEQANKDLGLAFDDWDLDYYTKMFVEKIKRNPTSVECFDLAQSNSEHSRHWFFKGHMVINGEELPDSLFSLIMSTQQHSNDNNVIKFNDNSSGIKGYTSKILTPKNSFIPGPFEVKDNVTRHIIFTAETHNFPTGVAPFPGATTGTGGRIRDVQSTGRGAHVVAGTAGYSFGNLLLPDYILPWEDPEEYPSNFASPAEIAVEASNGASDYGNKFGEPVLAGFARSFGQRLPGGERREYIKPIMFSGGIGTLDGQHVTKMKPSTDMEVVKVGGPVYRIGVGGGAASSVQVQGDNKVDLDFGAVQRGDAEMEQKLNRVIRACAEQGADNPICSIHDQGAGGNGNVLKEIVEPAGAVIWADKFQLGDPTISILELWGAEYQESNALLVQQKDEDNLQKLGQRERCPVCFVGTITGFREGKNIFNSLLFIQLQNFSRSCGSQAAGRLPVDLDLDCVLASMPRKVFNLTCSKPDLHPLILPSSLLVEEALARVLRLPSVASKRYLTNKVDRSVTGLVAQQQCVGPLHTPLADVAVVAISYFDTVGSATAIGEQPVKGLVDSACGARLSVAESLTNLVFARATALKDVKCSGNWMWAAKLPGEGAALVEACKAMCDVMKQLGIAVDGGKDSLSMAARTGSEVVKAPGMHEELLLARNTCGVNLCGCPDIRDTVTPDLKCPGGQGSLLWVTLGSGKHRLGGSALAQCFKQVGDEVPDLDDPSHLVIVFNIVQKLLTEHKLTAGHDVSDGGLITCVLEMAFAGNCGLTINVPSGMQAAGDAKSEDNALAVLFAEEVGLVLETRPEDAEVVCGEFSAAGITCHLIGSSCAVSSPAKPQIQISVGNNTVLTAAMTELRDIWEETSFVLERRQANVHCVQQEQEGLKNRCAPPYTLTFDPDAMLPITKTIESPPRVAIIREEGSNGDREMAAAFTFAGFEAWDVNMQDIMDQKVTLDAFRGVAFVGGFSYADVCGSAKGWAATVRFNSTVRDQLGQFKARSDTFSLGVCNGCQLMGLLGWVAPAGTAPEGEPLQGVFLDHNLSQRYESRFSTVRVASCPAIMLHGMEDTVFGMWVSHGEGRMVFKDRNISTHVKSKNLISLRFVGDDGQPCTVYPLNPNGSADGIAGLCSEDGRHLAMMPHPERCALAWQCPWMPPDMRAQLTYSPWIRMFRNAFKWCVDGELQ